MSLLLLFQNNLVVKQAPTRALAASGNGRLLAAQPAGRSLAANARGNALAYPSA